MTISPRFGPPWFIRLNGRIHRPPFADMLRAHVCGTRPFAPATSIPWPPCAMNRPFRVLCLSAKQSLELANELDPHSQAYKEHMPAAPGEYSSESGGELDPHSQA